MDGFVLAGGRSLRMGVDKARVAWDGRPLALVVRRAMLPVCDRVALVRRSPADGLPWRDDDGDAVEVLEEPAVGAPHPLWGIAMALGASRTALVVVAPCDLPWLTSASVARLVAAAPSVAVGDGRVHPLLAVLPAEAAAAARRLAGDARPAAALVEALRLTEVPVPPGELRNLNAAADVPRPGPVERLLATVPWATVEERRRIVDGEVSRLAARGMIDPNAPRTG